MKLESVLLCFDHDVGVELPNQLMEVELRNELMGIKLPSQLVGIEAAIPL